MSCVCRLNWEHFKSTSGYAWGVLLFLTRHLCSHDLFIDGIRRAREPERRRASLFFSLRPCSGFLCELFLSPTVSSFHILLGPCMRRAFLLMRHMFCLSFFPNGIRPEKNESQRSPSQRASLFCGLVADFLRELLFPPKLRAPCINVGPWLRCAFLLNASHAFFIV